MKVIPSGRAYRPFESSSDDGTLYEGQAFCAGGGEWFFDFWRKNVMTFLVGSNGSNFI
jgi:hypothetical protein